jgi:phospholipid/cholesterol/gamma-HCH transport system permease protein
MAILTERAVQSIGSAGQIGALGLRAIATAFKPPYSWFQATIEETNILFRRCAVPLAVCMFAWTIGYAFILLTGFVTLLGAEDRMPGGLVLGFTREPIAWVSGMVFAGAAGAAITADMAARKNREELDALSVLGIDQVRMLIIPRIVASMIACLEIGLVASFVTVATVWGLGPYYADMSSGLVFKGIAQSLLTTDELALMFKFVVIGAFVGLVSSAKGLSAKGGTEGVGRAVNEAVVLTFAGVWVINSLVNLTYLTVFPQLADFKG